MTNLKLYLLEDKVFYDPLTHSIYISDKVESQLTLAIPASLCLLSLLQHKGEIVSHADLLAFAWESRGMMVSPNTLYQNMSILRKALVSLGVSDEMIKTVPKRGFVISSAFPVEFIYEVDEVDEVDDYSPTITVDIIQPDETEEITTARLTHFRHSFPYLRWGTLAVCCLIVFYFVYFLTKLWNEDIIPQYIGPDFTKVENIEDCQVYRNYSLRSDAFFTQFLADQKAVCGKEKWWYLINHPPSPQVSLLKCSHAMSEKRTDKASLCTSDFFTETGQND